MTTYPIKEEDLSREQLIIMLKKAKKAIREYCGDCELCFEAPELVYCPIMELGWGR